MGEAVESAKSPTRTEDVLDRLIVNEIAGCRQMRQERVQKRQWDSACHLGDILHALIPLVCQNLVEMFSNSSYTIGRAVHTPLFSVELHLALQV
jgi:hypothetical protein